MHSYNRLWAHVVFATKNRAPLITPSLEIELYPYLNELLVEQGCVPSIINGIADHVHLLFLQNSSRGISDIIKNVKGNSSHWINQNELTEIPFAWQVGYAAFSVSDSFVNKVYDYISKQKQHHENETTFVEYKNIIEAHNLHFDR